MTAKTEFCESLLGSDEAACIEWPWPARNQGYGFLYVGKRYYSASRYMCILAHGEPADGMEAAHECGNRGCVNPNHLTWKTSRENATDRERHGTLCRGEASPVAKLTDEDVRYIRLSDKTAVELAAELGINSRTINHARSGRRWGHIDVAPKADREVLRRAVPDGVRELLDQGVSQAEIGRRYGVSRATAHRWAMRLTDPETRNERRAA